MLDATFRVLTAGKPPVDHTFEGAINCAGSRITWSSNEPTRVVDVDYKGRVAHDPDIMSAIERQVARLPIAPSHWWFSRNLGAHLVYPNSLQACATAGIIALRARDWFLPSDVEVLTKTFAPPGEVFTPAKKGGLRLWWECLAQRGTASTSQIGELLADLGLEVGPDGGIEGRYKHIHCPFNPGENSQNDVPVQLFDDHIWCFSCGRALWYADLNAEANIRGIRGMVQGAVQFNNAKYTLRRSFKLLGSGSNQHERILSGIYEAAMLAYWGVDSDDAEHPFVRAVFTDFMYLWVGQLWRGWVVEATGEKPKRFSKITSLGHVPSAQFVAEVYDADGDFTWGPRKPDRAKTDAMYEGGSAPAGYPEHTPYEGVCLDVYDMFDNDRVIVCMGPQRTHPGVPQIRDAVDGNVEWAKRIFHERFPGMNLDLLQYLIAIIGAAEFNSAVSMTLISGGYGAGKTVTVEMAAYLLGKQVPGMFTITTKNIAKQQKELLEMSTETGPVLFFDEYAKNLDGAALEAEFAPFLKLYSSNQVRGDRLYQGQGTGTLRKPIIFARPDWPSEVLNNGQLGRRFINVVLSDQRGGVEWDQPARYDAWLGEDLTSEPWRAATILIADVVRRLFCVPNRPPSFMEIAATFGFAKLEESQDTEARDERAELLQKALAGVCLIGQKWAVADSAFAELIQGTSQEDQRHARAIYTPVDLMELDLQKILGTTCTVRLEVKNRGTGYLYRFSSKVRVMVGGTRRIARNSELLA